MVPRLSSYEEFWPYYVSEHMDPVTRRLHVFGTTMVFVALVAALVLDPLWFLTLPLFGYGCAWVGHFVFERNRPATFTYPWWSLRADFRMFRLTLLGRMGPQIERASRLYPRAAVFSDQRSAISDQ